MMFWHRKRPNDTGDGVQGRRQGAGRAIVALLALMMGGGWGLPLPGASGGPAAVCRAAASAASSGIRFQRVYNTIPPWNPWSPGPLEAAPTADGGFILAGIVGNPSFSSDFFVMKTDAAGNMQWSRTYNVLQEDDGVDLVPTPDGGFLLAGSTCCDGGKAVAEVLKINGSGDVLWNKTYRSSSVHILSIRRAVATSDGDFLLIGHSGPDATSVRMFAAKIGPDGTLRWSRTYDASTLSSATQRTISAMWLPRRMAERCWSGSCFNPMRPWPSRSTPTGTWIGRECMVNSLGRTEWKIPQSYGCPAATLCSPGPLTTIELDPVMTG
jgi:hypothetical protein